MHGFVLVAVLAVLALSESNLLSQAAREDVQEVRGFPGAAIPTQADRDLLVANYVQLTQRLANEMSVEELERAIVNAEREIALREAREVFDPVIDQLRVIAKEHAGQTAAHRAERAIEVLLKGAPESNPFHSDPRPRQPTPRDR